MITVKTPNATLILVCDICTRDLQPGGGAICIPDDRVGQPMFVCKGECHTEAETLPGFKKGYWRELDAFTLSPA